MNLTDTPIATQVAQGPDLMQANADGTARLPLATTVVVDQSGIIAWIDVHPDYTTRSEPAQILAALDQIDQRAGARHQ